MSRIQIHIANIQNTNPRSLARSSKARPRPRLRLPIRIDDAHPRAPQPPPPIAHDALHAGRLRTLGHPAPEPADVAHAQNAQGGEERREERGERGEEVGCGARDREDLERVRGGVVGGGGSGEGKRCWGPWGRVLERKMEEVWAVLEERAEESVPSSSD